MATAFVFSARAATDRATIKRWVAYFSTEEEAFDAVREKAGPGWVVENTGEVVSPDNVAQLGLVVGEVIETVWTRKPS